QYPQPQYPPQKPPNPLMPYAPEIAPPPPATVAPPMAPPRALAPEPAPKYRYSEVTRPRWGMFGGGAGLFALSWGIPAIMGASVGYGKLAIPFAGPILLITDTSRYTLMPLLPYVIIDVLAQATGAIVAIAGLLTTEKVYVYKPAQLTLAPSVTPSFAGLAVIGRF
ncbi:MAG TPA: hypothetical protein VFF06_01690, partial [Polyangia bacterium]|nr:hypothetical protein [Polyangia bacterium]